MGESDDVARESGSPEHVRRPFRRRERPIPTFEEGMAVGFTRLEVIRATEKSALLENDMYPSDAQRRFDYGVDLAWQLADARKERDYNDDLGKSVFIIFTKAMNDFLATAHLSRSGYHLPAMATLRGGLEATELLEYLIANPSEVRPWMNKAKKFDNLGRIRKQLPRSSDRDNVFDVINNVFHCNAVESLTYLSRTQDDGRKTMITGPLKLDPGVVTALDVLSSLIPYLVRVLWRHNPRVASKEWIARFHEFDKGLKFPLGDPWSPDDPA